MSEASEYQWLKKVFKAPARIERIENVITAGTLDCNYCVTGSEGWIEIKAPTEPKRLTTPLFGSNHKLSQDQCNWILAQRKAGGRAFVWIGTNKRRMLIPGLYADEINHMCVGELLDCSIWSALRGARINPQELLLCFK